MSGFLGDGAIGATRWQAFERMISRYLTVDGYDYVGVVGMSGDGGADVLAVKGGRRWLVQVKRWGTRVGSEVVAETIAAARTYSADIPVIVSKAGFAKSLIAQRNRLSAEGINLQLWDIEFLQRRMRRLPDAPLSVRNSARYATRAYQEDAIAGVVSRFVDDNVPNALVVLATGLGKTFVAAEAVRRIVDLLPTRCRTLVVAHTNDLVYQLERSFWPFLRSSQSTVIVNGNERPDWTELPQFDVAFASRDTLLSALRAGVDLPHYDVVVVDECHHLGADSYEEVLDGLGVGAAGGPFLLGLTATPWRPNGEGLDRRFGEPVVSIDVVRGMKSGYLSNVDYRIYTDNVDWDRLRTLKGDRFTPRGINRTLFINEWDDAVIGKTQEAWEELNGRGRAIIFCGTVDHAERIANSVNAIGFARAAAIYSRSSAGTAMTPIERNRMILDFADGRIQILCAVDVLNEGVDVPDVSLVVFQRVTHSRRIFVQQLGRGLRLAEGKDKVIVLDFVSDIRRFAAGLELRRALSEPSQHDGPVRLDLHSTITFHRANSSDEEGAAFLREWLGDLEAVEAAGEDVSVLRYPPPELLPKERA